MKRATPASTYCHLNYILKFRIPVFIILMLITGVICFQLKNMKMVIKDPLTPLYPTGHIFKPVLKAANETFPLQRRLVCLLKTENGDIYNSATIKKIENITKGLLNIDGVLPSSVTSLSRGMKYFNNTAQGLYMDPIMGNTPPKTDKDFKDLKRKVAVSPMGPGKYVSYDGTTVMISALLETTDQRAKQTYKDLSDEEKEKISFEKYKRKEDDSFNSRLVKNLFELKAKEDDAGHMLFFMGEQVLTGQLQEIGKKHIPVAAGIMFTFIIIFLAFYFRTCQGLFIPLFSMIFAVIWSMGLYTWAGIEFNPMALLFPVILAALTLALSALALNKFYHEYDDNKDKHQAIKKVYSSMPVKASVITAGMIMLTMWTADVPMVKDLGSLGIFWFIGAFATIMVITPIMLSLLPLPSHANKEITNEADSISSRILAKLTSGKGKYIIIIIMAASIVCGSLSTRRLEVGGNVPGTDYIQSDHPWNQCFNLLSEKFMGPSQLNVYVAAKEEGDILDPDVMGAIADFSIFLKSECNARDCIAIDYMVQMAQVTMMDGSPKWQTLPMEKDKLKGLAGMVMEQGGEVKDFIDKTATKAVISPFFPDKDAKSIDNYSAKMQEYIDEHPFDKVTFSLGSGLLGMTKPINDGTRTAYQRIIATALFGVLVLSILLTRSLFNGLMITLPVVTAQSILWLIMVSTGIPVSMPAAPAAAAALGFGAVFGYILIQPSTDKNKGNSGIVLFTGLLIFAMALPWFFIGMKYQAGMVMFFGTTVFLEMITCLVVMPSLVDMFKVKYQ